MKINFFAHSFLLLILSAVFFAPSTTLASSADPTVSPVDSSTLVNGATYSSTQIINYTFNWSYPRLTYGQGLAF